MKKDLERLDSVYIKNSINIYYMWCTIYCIYRVMCMCVYGNLFCDVRL